MTRREQVQQIRNAINPRYIRSVLMDLSVFHREDSSDGIIAAAHTAEDLFKKAGLKTHLHTFTDHEDYYKTTPSMREWRFWQATEGWCEVVGEPGRKIADVRADPICVHRMSFPCDYRDKPVEIVLMDKGSDEKNYEGVDFEGKIIFIQNQTGHYFNLGAYTSWAIGKRGAVGSIVSAVATVPGLRGTWNQYDTISWARSYWGSFSFGITPKEGDRLANLYYAKKAKGEKLEVYCYIKVEEEIPEKSIMKNAEGYIEGTGDEEVVLYAHLCHPRPSTNDNLSGCSAVLSAMYALNELISRGALPRPKRTIRGIVGPEMMGTVAEIYRTDHDVHKIRAAINMDMVGAQQGPVGVGPVFLCDAPRSTPNFVNDVASLCMEEVTKDIQNFGLEYVCTHNMTQTTFSPGSDHDVWSDPESGVPCPCLGQWPDRFYHSSSDDISTMDPTLIARSAAISAAYAYIIATLEPEDLPLIMAKGLENMTRTVIHAGYDGDLEYYCKTMHHIRDYYLACCDQYVTFFDGEDKKVVADTVAAQKERINAIFQNTVDSILNCSIDLDAYPYDGSELPEKYQFVPKKHFIGKPFSLSRLGDNFENGAELIAEFERNQKVAMNRCDFLSLYYSNGERTFAECITRSMLDRQVKGEKAQQLLIDTVYDYFMLLEKLGGVTIK